MYPENNQAPIDYLNQIAPAPHKPKLSPRALIAIVIGIGLIITLFAIVVTSLSGGSSSTSANMQTLAARLQAMQEVSDKSQATIQSSNLRGTNSNLKIFLTNANHDIIAPLSANGIDIKKLDKTIVAKEKTDKITTDLENARLNAIFDDTYAREMAYKLTTIALLMDQIYSHTKSASMKEFLVKTDANLQPIKTQLETFNATAR
jgi:hypothetical protein